ncbi:transporter substrate-binding domain-containing protein [Lentisphaerota bacterium ZTH]|nr:transporter substrate-binding domain-containing protein [Lentisphaerota bacterium]WET07301.1 transporter substrate-binding domain-containing protein [Lentisphaerota bacterium ZTH]
MKILKVIGMVIITLVLCSCNDEQVAPKPSDKLLRVLTAGDYPPLTWQNPETGKYSGFAIDMAHSLGMYLNKKVVFVKTTWAELGSDLMSGKADIAMGGITATPLRKKYFLFSAPVMRTGKTLLIRKADKDKYKTLADVDQKDVKVVENKGGTNEIFARRELKNAKLIIVQNNTVPFDYLLSGKADVMITDTVEAIYKANIHPELYAVDPQNPMEKSCKIYLIPKGNKAFQEKVNEWLQTVRAEGTVEKYMKENKIFVHK